MVLGHFFRGGARMTRATEKQPIPYITLIEPLCLTLQQLMAEHWPEAVKHLSARASSNGDMLVGAELRLFSELPDVVAPPIFSTVNINRNALFPSHQDGGNSCPPSCLAAFGEWAGAALCFPRLRVAFDLKPGDVLIADTMNEQHGNVGLLAGTRISVVAYLRERARDEGAVSRANVAPVGGQIPGTGSLRPPRQ